ncbi:hypothetical protein EV426DRAFT_380931 [Tirmania nivea]|nr:hypothetical protein EV426DRAFT_380931 [Tirmania nivea]
MRWLVRSVARVGAAEAGSLVGGLVFVASQTWFNLKQFAEKKILEQTSSLCSKDKGPAARLPPSIHGSQSINSISPFSGK